MSRRVHEAWQQDLVFETISTPGDFPRTYYHEGRVHVGLVLEGATTPWSWASYGGLPAYHYGNDGVAYPRFWIRCERRPSRGSRP